MSLGRTLVVQGLSSVAALCAAAPALALSVGDSAQLIIDGTIEPRCNFTDIPAAKSLGALQSGQTIELGLLGFRCNLPDQPNVQLTIESQHGALQRDGGTEQVGYDVSWDVQGHGADHVPAASFFSQLGFNLSAGQAGAKQVGSYRIRITGNTSALIAGTYRDRITYTVSP